jgi:hypothetical protein
LRSFTASQLLHEALPFVEAAAKAKLAGSIETYPGVFHGLRIFSRRVANQRRYNRFNSST